MTAAGRRRGHAVRVATVATAVVAACYLVTAVVLDVVVVHRLTAETDSHLAAELAQATGAPHPASQPATGPAAIAASPDTDDAPTFLWRVTAAGAVHPLTVGAPTLARGSWRSHPLTVSTATGPFRLDAVRSASGWLVAGQSTAAIARARAALLLPELVLGLVLVGATFVGALVVGLRASAPVDLVRRRQAEFTADASHELRTPLAVIEAEADLALRRRRKPAEYEAVLRRVADEGRRLHRIVDDLLWLARAEGGPIEPQRGEPADLAAAAAACVERFQPVAQRQGVTLGLVPLPEGRVLVPVPSEWVDRLAGALVDNACKYAERGGRVKVAVEVVGGRAGLLVDDDGPGIPPEQRTLVFDRFHRATTRSGGAGLGLAIADSVVRATGGHWSIGEAPLGGARMAAWWRRQSERPAARLASRGQAPEGAVKHPDGDLGVAGTTAPDVGRPAGPAGRAEVGDTDPAQSTNAMPSVARSEPSAPMT